MGQGAYETWSPGSLGSQDIPVWGGMPQCLSRRYRLDRLLGAGGMAWVFEADDLESGDRVAAKVVRPGSRSGRAAARLAAEAMTMRTVAHPNVPRILDVDRDEASGLQFMVMELAIAGSTSDWVRASGAVAAPPVAAWAVQVLAALSRTHDLGYVHRDVKPANVLLAGGGRALLTDFGVALTPAGDMRVRPMAIVGTLAYMAPEQRRAPTEAGPAADLYALGATLYYLVTGASPRALYEAEREDSRWHGVPPELRHVVYRATRAGEAARYPDAHAMARALAPLVPPSLWTGQPHLDRWLTTGITPEFP